MSISQYVRNCEEFLQNYELPEYLREKAREELGETTDVRNEKVIELVKMIEADEETTIYLQFRTAVLIEKLCLLYLRQSKFNQEKAFDRIKRYHEAQLRYGQDIWNMRFPYMIPVFKGVKCGFLDNKDADGCFITYASNRDWDPDLISGDDCLNALGMLVTKAMTDSHSQVCGMVCIVDFGGIELRQLKALSLRFIRKTIDLATKILPIRFKALHIVNESKPVKLLIKISSPWLPKKIRGRIYLHGSDMESLHRFIDPTILPAELQGSLPPFDNEKCVRNLMEFEQELLEYVEVGLPNREE